MIEISRNFACLTRVLKKEFLCGIIRKHVMEMSFIGQSDKKQRFMTKII